MDVSCERCKAEYEFDDSLLGEHGTTVKCSSCNHVFRVMPHAREPSRPSLKVRSVASGRVEPLSSLRDLQRRIHAGEVSADDELGREGFPWRKLSEVPELRTFFVKPNAAGEARTGNTYRAQAAPSQAAPSQAAQSQAAAASRGAAALSVSQSSMPAPPRKLPPSAQRTILGVGPQNPQIPGPPRVPNLSGPTPAAKPANGPAAGVKAAAATVPQRLASGAANAASDSDAPTDPPPAKVSSPPRALPPLGSTPPLAPSNPVAQLYLADDEAPPARATASASRIWLIAGVAGGILLLVIVVIGAWRSNAPTPVAPAPRVEAVAPKPEAAPPVADPAAAAPAVAAGTTELTPKAKGATKPSPAPAAGSAAAPPPDEADERDKPEARRAKSADKEPTDYTGFVAQGDAALARGDGAAARKSYETALEMRASGAEATTGLGYALLSEGKGREAITYFDRASRNGYAEASIGLGDAHKKLGDVTAARKAYKSYLERLPNGARASYVQKQLEALPGGDVGRAEPRAEPEDEAPTPSPAGSEEYRPAGELTEPAPAPQAPAAEPAPEADPAGEAVP